MLFIVFISLIVKSSSDLIENIPEDEVFVDPTSFSVVVKQPYFVDKSLLIKSFLEGPTRVHVITPSGFGKSTNMNMIKSFCEIHLDEEGTTIRPDNTDEHVMFTKRYVKRTIRINLDIYRKHRREFFDEHFQKYPVIFLDFKKLRGVDFYNFIIDFIKMTKKAYSYHDYAVIWNQELKKDDIKIFEQYLLVPTDETCTEKNYAAEFLNYTVIKSTDEQTLANLLYNLSTAFLFLSEMLYKYFNRNCIILIDHYDHPLLENMFNNGTDLDRIIKFLQMLWRDLFVASPFIDRVMINSRMRVSYEDNIHYYLFYEKHSFNNYYGFTEYEMVLMTDRLKVRDQLDKLRACYGGCRVSPGVNRTTYHAYSVARYLESFHFGNYQKYSNTYSNIMGQCFNGSVRQTISSLLNYDFTQITFQWKSPFEILHLQDAIRHRTNVTRMSRVKTNLFLRLMLDFGYFKVVGKTSDGHDTFYNITIPNAQMRDELITYCPI